MVCNIRLKVLLRSYVGVEAKAKAATSKALKTAERSAVLAEKPMSAGGAGAAVRSWDRIIAMSQQKSARYKGKERCTSTPFPAAPQ